MSLDLPWEDAPGGPIPLDVDSIPCGGLVVRAGVIDAGGKPLPCLIFTFYRADGHVLPAITLVQEPAEMGKVTPLITHAVAASLRAVKEAS